MDSSSASISPHGLLFNSTPAIQHLLSAATSSSSTLPAQTQLLASQYLASPTIPYSLIRHLWKHTQHHQHNHPPHLCHILEGATIHLQSPAPREKSEELKERLRKLQDEADWRSYKELVKDVAGTPADDAEPFSSYKDQLGFGLHVMVTMFTGFMGGYFLFRSQFQNTPSLHAAGGILGLCVGMLVETLLFVIRSYQYEKASSRGDKRHSSLSHTRVKSRPMESIASLRRKKYQ